MENGSRIVVYDAPDRTFLVAEMYLHGEYLGLVRQEERRGQFAFVPVPPRQRKTAVSMRTYLHLISTAIDRLGAVA